jgi:purine-binding chemotaxis protein CheW
MLYTEVKVEKQIHKQRQYVVFQIGTEEYGVNIIQVKEIVKPGRITNVPNTSDYVLGVINLRGQIIPVINLRKRFEIEVGKSSKAIRRIITVEIDDKLLGLLVDGVNEVVWLSDEEIEPAPEVAGGIKQEFLKGIGRIDNRLLVIIDLEKLLFDDRNIEEL